MRSTTRELVLSGLFLALGLLLPFITGQIPALGNKVLPMHIPIILCGFICGRKYGLLVGFVTPLLRSLIFTMPPILMAVAMAFELAAYGFLAGLLYKLLPKKNISVYVALIISMIGGRIIWGIASYIIFSINGMNFTMAIFMAGAFLNAIPGIIIQLILIPALVIAFRKDRF